MTMSLGLFLLLGSALAQTKVNGTVVSKNDGDEDWEINTEF